MFRPYRFGHAERRGGCGRAWGPGLPACGGVGVSRGGRVCAVFWRQGGRGTALQYRVHVLRRRLHYVHVLRRWPHWAGNTLKMQNSAARGVAPRASGVAPRVAIRASGRGLAGAGGVGLPRGGRAAAGPPCTSGALRGPLRSPSGPRSLRWVPGPLRWAPWVPCWAPWWVPWVPLGPSGHGFPLRLVRLSAPAAVHGWPGGPSRARQRPRLRTFVRRNRF